MAGAPGRTYGYRVSVEHHVIPCEMNGEDLPRCAHPDRRGGIAGLEAALALADLAGDRLRITLMSPEPEFHFKPLAVEEPFTKTTRSAA